MKLSQLGAFLIFVGQNYEQDRCLRSAAALSFTTLLSLVPLIAVVFSAFSAFPVFVDVSDTLRNFIFENFVPTTGESVQAHIQQFTDKAGKLTAIGTIVLVITALMLINTIESAMNDIWQVKESRKLLPKFMVYWAALTLGPLLLGASIAASAYLLSLPLFSDTELASGLKQQLLGLTPFLASTIACTLLYTLVPYTRVPVAKALAGALVAALLLELAKKGFAAYITAFPTYELIYGALATIPVFLVWLYLSWLIVLLGAEVAYSLDNFSITSSSKVRPKLDRETEQLLADFKILGLIWQGQQQGSLVDHSTFRTVTDIPSRELSQMLHRLESANLIHRTDDHQWALTCDISTLTLRDLLRVENRDLPHVRSGWNGDTPWEKAFVSAVRQSEAKLEQAFDQHLTNLYQGEAGTNHGQRREPTLKL